MPPTPAGSALSDPFVRVHVVDHAVALIGVEHGHHIEEFALAQLSEDVALTRFTRVYGLGLLLELLANPANIALLPTAQVQFLIPPVEVPVELIIVVIVAVILLTVLLTTTGLVGPGRVITRIIVA